MKKYFYFLGFTLFLILTLIVFYSSVFTNKVNAELNIPSGCVLGTQNELSESNRCIYYRSGFGSECGQQVVVDSCILSGICVSACGQDGGIVCTKHESTRYIGNIPYTYCEYGGSCHSAGYSGCETIVDQPTYMCGCSGNRCDPIGEVSPDGCWICRSCLSYAGSAWEQHNLSLGWDKHPCSGDVVYDANYLEFQFDKSWCSGDTNDDGGGSSGYCGNGICEASENSTTCPADCNCTNPQSYVGGGYSSGSKLVSRGDTTILNLRLDTDIDHPVNSVEISGTCPVGATCHFDWDETPQSKIVGFSGGTDVAYATYSITVSGDTPLGNQAINFTLNGSNDELCCGNCAGFFSTTITVQKGRQAICDNNWQSMLGTSDGWEPIAIFKPKASTYAPPDAIQTARLNSSFWFGNPSYLYTTACIFNNGMSNDCLWNTDWIRRDAYNSYGENNNTIPVSRPFADQSKISWDSMFRVYYETEYGEQTYNEFKRTQSLPWNTDTTYISEDVSNTQYAWGTQTSLTDSYGRTWSFQLNGSTPQYKCLVAAPNLALGTAPNFAGNIGGPTPASAPLPLTETTGKSDILWKAKTNQTWCHVNVGDGNVAGGGTYSNNRGLLAGATDNTTLKIAVDSPSTLTAGTYTCQITVDGVWLGGAITSKTANVTYVVNPPLQCDLSVSKTGSCGGTIVSIPAGINCGSTCSANFNCGTSVTLNIIPDAGCIFTGWTDDCSGTGTCTVTLDDPKDVTAIIDQIPPDFGLTNANAVYTTIIQGSSSVKSTETTIRVNGLYGFGSKVTLSLQSISPAVSGVTLNLSRGSLTSGQYSSGSVLSVNVPSSAANGTYMLTIRGEGGGLVRTTTVPLNVENFNPNWTEF
jgi:hypothetical protein